MQMRINLTPEQALEGVAEALRELDRVNDLLVEYGIEFPLGASGVKDMHSQLFGDAQDARQEAAVLKTRADTRDDYIKALEDTILGANNPQATDMIRFHAARIEDERAKKMNPPPTGNATVQTSWNDDPSE
jgi:hypothetical protein